MKELATIFEIFTCHISRNLEKSMMIIYINHMILFELSSLIILKHVTYKFSEKY